MRSRRAAVLVLALALPLAGGCGGDATGPVDRLERSLEVTLDPILADEGFGDARNVQCSPIEGGRSSCTADVPLGPDVFRETYAVEFSDSRCWAARQTAFGRLAGRDADAVARVRLLQGCVA